MKKNYDELFCRPQKKIIKKEKVCPLCGCTDMASVSISLKVKSFSLKFYFKNSPSHGDCDGKTL